MNRAPAWMAARFHATLVEMVVAMAHRQGEPAIVLSGGCFQNHLLTTRCIERLRAEGFTPYWQQWAPPNDGGISLGQAWVASYG
jgi:hydrogenase maturation protein HypF